MSAEPRFKYPLQAGIAIGRSMARIDPARDAAPFMRFRFETSAGEWAMDGHVSEAGAVADGRAAGHAHEGGSVMAACVFCAIVAGEAPATILREWDDAIAFRPRGGVNDGHTLVIPRVHVADAVEDPEISGDTMRRAAEYAAETGSHLNIITSVGEDATQTVYHLHLHVLPRAKADGLMLPWTPQQDAVR